MLSTSVRRYLIIALAIVLTSPIPGVSCPAEFSDSTSRVTEANTPEWRETSPTRVVIRSTADWGRILFDDLNGTNSNGIRIKSVVGMGWLEGKDSDDQIYAGRKIPWPDTEYDRVIARKGDMVAFFKGLRDFHPTEAYADLTLEVNIDLPRVYVWLMTGGNGTTTFEIVSRDTGGTIWRDVVVGTGETQQVRRVMSAQPFFRTGRTETTVLFAWLCIAIVAMIILNFPIYEVLRQRLRTKRSKSEPNPLGLHIKGERDMEEGAEQE